MSRRNNVGAGEGGSQGTGASPVASAGVSAGVLFSDSSSSSTDSEVAQLFETLDAQLGEAQKSAIQDSLNNLRQKIIDLRAQGSQLGEKKHFDYFSHHLISTFRHKTVDLKKYLKRIVTVVDIVLSTEKLSSEVKVKKATSMLFHAVISFVSDDECITTLDEHEFELLKKHIAENPFYSRRILQQMIRYVNFFNLQGKKWIENIFALLSSAFAPSTKLRYYGDKVWPIFESDYAHSFVNLLICLGDKNSGDLLLYVSTFSDENTNFQFIHDLSLLTKAYIDDPKQFSEQGGEHVGSRQLNLEQEDATEARKLIATLLVMVFIKRYESNSAEVSITQADYNAVLKTICDKGALIGLRDMPYYKRRVVRRIKKLFDRYDVDDISLFGDHDRDLDNNAERRELYEVRMALFKRRMGIDTASKGKEEDVDKEEDVEFQAAGCN